MKKTYRISYLIGPLDGSICPHPIIWAVFPDFDGWPSETMDGCAYVTVPDSAPAPVNLGPLVKVELVSE